MTWQLQEAKNKFSQVFNDSLSKGPQIVSRRGQDRVVIINYQEYQRLIKPPRSLKETLKNSPFHDLDIARDKSTTGRATPLDYDEPDTIFTR